MLLVLAGMIWGLQMAITDNHSAFTAHAHLNLLGFVALFLFGIFYRLNPTVEFRTFGRSASFDLDRQHGRLGHWRWAGSHGPSGRDPIAAVWSFAIFADAILFTWLVFQVRPTEDRASRVAVVKLSPLRSRTAPV